MKIKINIPRDVALANDSDSYGDAVVAVAASAMSAAQKQTLSDWAGARDCDCDYDLSRATQQGYVVAIRGLAPAAEASPAAVLDLLDRLAAQLAANAAEKAAQEAAEEADRRAEAEAQSRLPLSAQVIAQGVGVVWPLKRYADLRGPAEAECERLHEAEQRRKAEREAEREAASADKHVWIGAYGSPRLKRMVDANIECDATYRDERLAHDLPGWVYDSDELTDSIDAARNPSEAALDLLDAAQRSQPAASLIYWARDARVDEEGEEASPGARGYAAESEFLGRRILFFGQQQ